MNTFLPYSDIVKSIKCLDSKRLGKQRVEAMQILKALSKGPFIIDYQTNTIIKQTPWYNHPAVKMWQGYELCLETYMNCCIFEWISRGFKNTMLICWSVEHKYYYSKKLIELMFDLDIPYPSWWGNKSFHNSHKSNLIRKFSEHYKQFNWNVPNNLPYVWPKAK